jgi:hypothetical protein
MDKMNLALEKMKMLVGMEVEEEEEERQAASLEANGSFSFMDDFNRSCTLSTKQVGLCFCLRLVAPKKIKPRERLAKSAILLQLE